MKKISKYFNKEINLVSLLGGKAGRLRLEKFICYTFILLCLLPLLVSLALPYGGDNSIDPHQDLMIRVATSLATGGSVFFCSIAVFLLVGKFSKLQGVCIFLLLPVSLVAIMMQVIMYKEFGMEINYRVIGLFREDFEALWSIARKDYYAHWWAISTVILSFYVTKWVFSERSIPVPTGSKLGIMLGLLLISSGVVASAMRQNIERLAFYHPAKTSQAPVFQLAALCQSLITGPRTGYESILERSGKYESSVAQVIRERLGTEVEEFTERTSSRPEWLKKEPSHVFLFLMESMESKLIEDTICSKLAPNLNTFAREGLYVSKFVSAGYSTIEAVHAISTGTAPIYRYPIHEYPQPRVAKMYAMDTLPKLLRESGYKPLFLSASFRKFRSKGDVAEAYGYDQFIGCPDVAPDITANDWGVNDADFFKWSKGMINDLTEPHFITFLNVSNHAPFDAPVDSIRDSKVFTPRLAGFFHGNSEQEKLKYAKHMFYADLQMGMMVRDLKERYPDALFVFIGDHNSRKLKGLMRGRVPFVLWNDRVIDSDVDTSCWYGSHMDVLATLAEMLLPEGSSYQTLGSPVWSRDPARVSIGNERILCSQGIFKFDQESAEMVFSTQEQPPRDGTSESNLKQLQLKASSIEALSWGVLHSVPIPSD